MLDKLKEKDTLRTIGIVVVGGVVLLAWVQGWFAIIFYILGLYAAVYIASYIFKTTGIIDFLLGAGGFILYAISTIIGLFILFKVLEIMFTESFWQGVFWFILLSIFSPLLQLIPLALGLILGYPLVFMSEDIEKRFAQSKPIEGNLIYQDELVDDEQNLLGDVDACDICGAEVNQEDKFCTKCGEELNN